MYSDFEERMLSECDKINISSNSIHLKVESKQSRDYILDEIGMNPRKTQYLDTYFDRGNRYREDMRLVLHLI